MREVMKTQAIVVFGDAKPKPNSLAGDLLKLAVQMAWKRSQSLGDAEPEESPSNLTLREVECLRWASKGKTHEEVGRVLSISARTVRFHIQNAKAKMKVETRIQAVARLLKDQPVRASAVRLAAGDR